MVKQLLLTLMFSLFLISALNAQEIEYKNNVYEVKGSSILLHGYDVTESITLDDQRAIFEAYAIRAEEYRKEKRNKRIQNKAIAKAYRKELRAQEKAERMSNNEKRFVIF
ncbi:hypothetical protein ACJOV8_006505 [Formosa sp. 3Alg 14/1]|uniref:hypothetical protein n=1 Tax=unclassified Formosa TaxID=2644710 RepID=UPI0039BE595A